MLDVRSEVWLMNSNGEVEKGNLENNENYFLSLVSETSKRLLQVSGNWRF